MKRLAWATIALFGSAIAAQASDFELITTLLDDGYRLITTSYQGDLSREAIYLEKAGNYWVCLVSYQLEDTVTVLPSYTVVKAPYAGGGACFPLSGKGER